jgi:hypothetical protein
VLREDGKAVSRENAKALALLLPIVHIAEEGIRLGSEVVIDTHDVLILPERIRVLKVDLLFVAKAIVVGGMTEATPISGGEVF